MDLHTDGYRSELVFHYTTADTALQHIIPKMQLRLGHYDETNDPRESKDWQLAVKFNVEHYEKQDRKYTQSAWDQQQKVQSSLLVLCCTMDSSEDGATKHTELRGYGKSRMWAMYAGDDERRKHEGVCLVLNRSNLTKAIQDAAPRLSKIWACGIRYKVLADRTAEDQSAYTIDGDQVKSIGDVEALQEHVEAHIQTLMFTKSLDWADENEFRWILRARESEEEVFVPLNGVLVGVIAGLDFPQGVIGLLSHVCIKVGVPLYRMQWHQGHWVGPALIRGERLNGI